MEDICDTQISEASNALIDEVLEAYGGFGAYELERLTHSERPWVEARRDLPPDSASNNLISEDTMRDYYRSLHE